jgi:methionyl-tRNA formyltransferase
MEVKVIFMGTPEFAAPTLESLIRGPYEVVAVYTQPDKPAGRRRRLTLSPVKRLALEYNIPVIQPETFKSPEVLKELIGFKPKIIVVAAFGFILPRTVLSLPKFGCVNIHPSLLPYHRGPSPVAHALLCGDLLTGVTITLIDTRVDSGPILSRRDVNISPQDTTGSLTSRLAEVGAELLMETLPKWLGGELEPKPQDELGATYSRMINSEDGVIDWHLPALNLWWQVRAFNPWPVCYTWWQGKRLKIHEAVPIGERANGEIGEVIALSRSGAGKAGVVTKEGILELCQVQLEGKRQMPIAAFMRGQKDFIGSILV